MCACAQLVSADFDRSSQDWHVTARTVPIVDRDEHLIRIPPQRVRDDAPILIDFGDCTSKACRERARGWDGAGLGCGLGVGVGASACWLHAVI